MSRFSFPDTSPALFKSMYGLATAIVENGKVPAVLRDLIECRVSQINQCSFCLRMHAKSFAEHGGDAAKLTMLPVWRAADGFDDAERAALDWAECLTRIESQERIAQSHGALLAHFEADAISELTCVISTMNAWNRLGIAQHEFA
ncbi:carboxymuconolactone decarboxylase family protein [Thalassospira povalilytica]|uniref:Carboxymuconolactone decarboxylase family protein n=1 Tax=Thalassospira povalilytica TaxID=732237 RepID=A0ABX4R8J8_9PROT|nr:carboxymuconolactone decarboxylase family protein [Thalassospira povalilytica]PKR49371.1 carboxymuconolactone decarboxylase family protein [Thalassospira povalilytica]